MLSFSSNVVAFIKITRHVLNFFFPLVYRSAQSENITPCLNTQQGSVQQPARFLLKCCHISCSNCGFYTSLCSLAVQYSCWQVLFSFHWTKTCHLYWLTATDISLCPAEAASLVWLPDGGGSSSSGMQDYTLIRCLPDQVPSLFYCFWALWTCISGESNERKRVCLLAGTMSSAVTVTSSRYLMAGDCSFSFRL